MFAAPLIPVVAGMSASIPALCGGLLAVAVTSLVVRWLESFIFDN